MKKIAKFFKIIFLAIIIIFIILMIIGTLVQHGVLKTTEDKPEVTINYDPNHMPKKIDEEAIPDSSYYDSLEEALEHGQSVKSEEKYQNQIDEIIKRFENDRYVTLYFKSVKDKNTECFTLAKFRKKEINGNVEYTFLASIPSESNRTSPVIGRVQDITEGQLALSDFMQDINIDPESTRFICGDSNSKEIYKLRVEGQEPTEIVPYKNFDEQWYFWYYENLESDKAGSQLEVTFE